MKASAFVYKGKLAVPSGEAYTGFSLIGIVFLHGVFVAYKNYMGRRMIL